MAGIGSVMYGRPARVGGAMGTVETAVAAGLGVYALDYILGMETGSVKAPLVGSMSARAFQSIVAGLASAAEDTTKPYVPRVVGQYGGNIGIDVAARGVVPVAAQALLTGDNPGLKGGAKQVAVVYAGSTLGRNLASQWMTR